MVKVGVGIQHILDREALPLYLGQDALRIAAGIDDGTLLGFGTTDDIAVGLDHADGQGSDDQRDPPGDTPKSGQPRVQGPLVLPAPSGC